MAHSLSLRWLAALSPGRLRRGAGRSPDKLRSERPAGTTERLPVRGADDSRPGILDYRPHFTLVVLAHPVPRAKFPRRISRPPARARHHTRGAGEPGRRARHSKRRYPLSSPRTCRASGCSVVSAVGRRCAPRGARSRAAFQQQRGGRLAIAQLEADVAGAVGGEIGGSLASRPGADTRLRLDDRPEPVWAARGASSSSCPPGQFAEFIIRGCNERAVARAVSSRSPRVPRKGLVSTI